MLSCHSGTLGNHHVEVTIAKVAKEVSASRHDRLEFSGDASFPATAISATGTVLNAYNSVWCSLTPIDCNTGDPIPGGSIQNAAATFTDATDWAMSFAPLPLLLFLQLLNSRSVAAICWRPRQHPKEPSPFQEKSSRANTSATPIRAASEGTIIARLARHCCLGRCRPQRLQCPHRPVILRNDRRRQDVAPEQHERNTER